MIRISLPDDDLQRLEDTLRETPDAKLRHRVQIVLMARRGRRHPDIAADTGTSPRSVQRWLNAYLDRGLDGRRPQGTPRSGFVGLVVMIVGLIVAGVAL